MSVRESALAGTWYPADAAALRRQVQALLDAAGAARVASRPSALISPHAGYAYSGATAAHAFAQVRGLAYARVVVLGPLHRPIPQQRSTAFMTAAEQRYRTPLGDVPLDRDFIARLQARVPLTEVHGDQEHALEIELPFLQVALPPFQLVPILAGIGVEHPLAPALIEQLAGALADLSRDGETLLVASTDLTHCADHAVTVAQDARLAALVAGYDLPGLAAALRQDEVQACGAVPLLTVLRAAQLLGAGRTTILDQTTSGDVTGKTRPGVYCVGYLAAAIHA